MMAGCLTPLERELLDALRAITATCDHHFAPSFAALDSGSCNWREGRDLRNEVEAAKRIITKAENL